MVVVIVILLVVVEAEMEDDDDRYNFCCYATTAITFSITAPTTTNGTETVSVHAMTMVLALWL